MTALGKEDTVAVVGAGAMGAGIAQVAAMAGHEVLLHDASAGAVDKALSAIGKALAVAVEKGKLSAADSKAIHSRIRPCADVSEFTGAHLVVEAIVERLDVKRELFHKLESIVADDAILGTNTSSLSITAIAQGLRNPGRVAGMHFFNPPHLMKLVEVVSGLATSPQVADTVFATATAWGKIAVHARSTPGLIVNRVARPFYGEGLRLLLERAGDVATIDRAMREAGGFRMGPFELMDLIGHDVSVAVTQSVYDAYAQDARYKPSLLQQELVAAGRLGRKSGQGFYAYPQAAQVKDKGKPAASAAVPKQVVALDDTALLAPLREAASEAGVSVGREQGVPHAGFRVDGVLLLLTDGTPATLLASELGAPVVVFDLALDYRQASAIAIAKADQATQAHLDTAVAFFAALGKTALVLDDCPGLAVMRTVAMLANEGADAVHQGVASAQGVDVAMVNGVNYPIGPMEWADRIGLARVLRVIEQLDAFYRDGRYRVSALLRRRVASGGSLR
jgi:3-hydroxybutyryl-CoA dehydrogenase